MPDELIEGAFWVIGFIAEAIHDLADHLSRRNRRRKKDAHEPAGAKEQPPSWKKKTPVKRSVPVPVLLGIAAVLAVLGLPLLDPLTRARVWNGIIVSAGAPLLIIVAVIVAAAITGFILDRPVLTVAIVVLGLGGLIFYGNWRAYAQERTYAAIVKTTDDPIQTLKERAPFQVAERQASSSLSGINGTLDSTDYLADSNTYSTLVKRNGPFNPGYTAIVAQHLELTGQATGTPCTFDEHTAPARMDGWFGNSLPRLIATKDTSLVAHGEDAWGYCDGTTPTVVVPVTRLSGWLAPIQVPAGVAVYNGKTGALDYRPEVKAGDLPGPAVGISFVHQVNGSLETLNGDWWSMVTNQSGLTDQVKDADDPNKDNPSEFSLAYKGAPGSVYVSPFTSRASSRSIEDVEVLESGHVKDGQMPTVALHHLAQPRQSNAATADKVKATFSDLNWASGLSVQEIVPVSHDEWAASIGLKQNVVYRVLVKADGSSCLADANGQPVRCVDANGTVTSGTAGATGAQQPGSQAPVAVPSNVAGLSNADLAKLQSEVTAEVLRRLAAQPAGK